MTNCSLKRLLCLLIICSAVTLAAAKSTKLIFGWKNPAAKAPPIKNVLVIGISADPGRRSDFEDALAASLARPGLQVIPGNSILLRPDASPVKLQYLREQIKAFAIDAVVVSRLISVKESITYYPPDYYSSFYGYYSAIAPIVYGPGYLDTETTVRIETNVYAITPPDGQLLWTGTSDTFNPSDAKKVISGVVKLVTEELNKAGVL